MKADKLGAVKTKDLPLYYLPTYVTATNISTAKWGNPTRLALPPPYIPLVTGNVCACYKKSVIHSIR